MVIWQLASVLGCLGKGLPLVKSFYWELNVNWTGSVSFPVQDETSCCLSRTKCPDRGGECGFPRPVSRLLLHLDILSGQKWERSLVWFLVSQLSRSLLSLSCRSDYCSLFQALSHFTNTILFTYTKQY
jgi:hypothetical protein